MFMRMLLTSGLLAGSLLVSGGYAQSDAPGKCDKQCRHDKSCRQGACNHQTCRIHRRCFKLCNLKPDVIQKDAAAAIADVTDKDARKALKLLYGKVKDGKENQEIKKAMWKTLLLMKANHCQNEHKRGHMLCPAHDNCSAKCGPQLSAPAPVGRRQARRQADGRCCADHAHHHHDPAPLQ